jgi:type IV pilus assembly protein PilM
MFQWMSKRRCGPIGLDIGADGVRMLQLCANEEDLRVAAAARWHYPLEMAAEPIHSPPRRQMLAEAVAELIRKNGFRGRRVVSCLRSEDVAVQNIRLPHMTEQELAKAVLWECKDRFEFDVTADRLYHVNAGEVRQGSEARDEVILMAARESAVAEHVEMLSALRLEPTTIDAEPLALFRAYMRFLRRTADVAAVSVIVDIGLASTKVVVARGQTILLVKTIDLAGRKLNEQVAKELNLPYAEAAHLRARGFEKPPAEAESGATCPVEWSVYDAIRGQVEALAHEVSLCLRYCAVTFRGLRPSQITLTGGEAYDAALVRLMGEHLDCPCVIGEPLRGIELGGIDLGGEGRSALTEWSVAAGLALRKFPQLFCSESLRHERRRLSA